MSDERKTDYDNIERYLLPHERCTLPSHPGIWVKDILTIIRDARQLTVERERADRAGAWLEELIATLGRADNLLGSFLQGGKPIEAANLWRTNTAEVTSRIHLVQPHAPNNPCPNCGATDRAHTCPNWQESEYLCICGHDYLTHRHGEARGEAVRCADSDCSCQGYEADVPQLRERALAALRDLVDGVGGKPHDVAERFVDAILAAIDVRLARGK